MSTIAAISTAQGPGGIGIVRISGEAARSVAAQVFFPSGKRNLLNMQGYSAAHGVVRDGAGSLIDEAIALVFAAPRSYTGEDVVELSCHGGAAVLRLLLQAVLQAGALPAAPGEFSKRAFLNGKMDLTKAESVMQVIAASGEQAAKAAATGQSGALGKHIDEIMEELTVLSAHLAAWADFPDEDIPQVEEAGLRVQLKEIEQGLLTLLDGYDRGRMLREGIETVIVGRTNAGKSTLMNLLSGCERSIVTQHAGTTRDVVEETVLLGGVQLRLSDTAGIRDTADPVEQIGVQRAYEKWQQAQLVLAVFDQSMQLSDNDEKILSMLEDAQTIIILNKSDLPQTLAKKTFQTRFSSIVEISALQGNGLDDLQHEIERKFDLLQYDPAQAALFTERQRQNCKQAADALKEAMTLQQVGMTLDAVTVCVEDALQALCRLKGIRVSDKVIDEVFEKFCVGK